MSAPSGHDRSRKPSEDDEEDPVENMISKTGCSKYHYAVQECMFEKKDWRLCQEEVKVFRECVAKSGLARRPNATPS